jgi:hypothetical protein
MIAAWAHGHRAGATTEGRRVDQAAEVLIAVAAAGTAAVEIAVVVAGITAVAAREAAADREIPDPDRGASKC